MCFDHGDSVPILRQGMRRARKRHRCTECSRKIDPGELYDYACGADYGDFHVWKICERCHIHAAYVYAVERAEGCAEWESRPPLGSGMLSEDLWERGLTIDDDKPDDEWSGWPAGDGPKPHFVVRWHHIDAARSGDTKDAPFTAEVARRLAV
jgi:hypothetical protein